MSELRRKEMEDKRAKLAELRRAREERQKLLQQAVDRGSGASSSEQQQQQPLTSRKDVNEFVDSLLSTGRPNSPYTPGGPSRVSSLGASAAPSAHPAASGRSTPPSASVPGTPGRPTSRLSDGSLGNERRGQASVSIGQGLEEAFSPIAPPAVVKVEYVDTYTEMYDLPSKVIKPETYSKAVQTAMVTQSTSTADLSESAETNRRRRDGGSGHETEDEMRTRIIAEIDEERRQIEKELKELKEKTDNLQLQHLPDDQRRTIFSSPDFANFIEGSARIVQRALSDGYDYIKDYTIGVDGSYDESEGQKVKLLCAFSDERWTANRSVTGLDWSPKFPELSVASYNRNPSAPNDPDGIVAVWNLHLLERPEFVFHSPSDILSVTFSPFHPNLIFGGSYSGQVLLWDTRTKHLPVLKTPLSASGHTYPIYAMSIVGTQNANSLITSSTDGLVCSWQVDMLSQPQEALRLVAPAQNKMDEVSITCLDFAENETATFWVGTEEGSVYQVNRFDRAAAKAGLNSEDIYRGHAGPVTGIHFHPSAGPIDFSDLFLTSSVDWTVKLWRTKAGGSKAAAAATTSPSQPAGIPPIHSFEEADDYVFDVKWHRSHPAMFGTVDGTGKFDLWNLNADVEVPIVSTPVSNRALNKLAWDRTPLARKVGLGGSDGKVYVYEVAEKLAQPRESEWVELQKTVQSLAANRDAGGGLGSVPLPEVATRFRV
ncbi:hypothetical protein Q8F55_008719 [Vanrija albida]|uniref:Dynein intermediate chain, cytosolic n=1 Tax=Vanrija albida TaxID=181172 RepID=A0ABR3PRL2_9TREE